MGFLPKGPGWNSQNICSAPSLLYWWKRSVIVPVSTAAPALWRAWCFRNSWSCCVLVVAWPLQEPDTNLLSSLLQGYEGSLIKLTSKQVPPSSCVILAFASKLDRPGGERGKIPFHCVKHCLGQHQHHSRLLLTQHVLNVSSCCPG